MSTCKARPISPVDPRDDLAGFLEFHRTTFASFRMEDDGDGSGDGGDGDGSGDGDGGKDDGGEDARIKQARDEAAARRKELKPWKDLGKELGLTPEQIRKALKNAPKDKADGKDKDMPDADAIRREAETAATEKANARIVRAEVKALAADLFADPADAPLYLDLTKYDVDDDGNVAADEVKADLKQLLKDKPHLAKKGAAPKPDPSQGKGGGTADVKPGVSRLRNAYAASTK
jgi:hypothetical protein